MNTEPIVTEVVVNAPVSAVWKAITDPEEMKKWYFTMKNFEPKSGCDFEFTGGDEKQQWRHLCQIKELELNKRLSHTWRYDNLQGESLVTWDLTDDNGKTKVKLSHQGTESFGELGKNFTRESFTGGWKHIVQTSLKDHFEKQN